MTKKHYDAIAKAFKASFQNVSDNPAYDGSVQKLAAKAALVDAAEEMAAALAPFRYNFDRERFLNACGVNDPA